MTTLPTEPQLLKYFEVLSNWGRWGEDDQIGTLNLITPQKRVEAARLIRSGTAVSMSRLLDPADPDSLGRESLILRHTTWTGESQVPHEHFGMSQLPDDFRLQSAREYVGIIAHGSTTHLDALSHVMWNRKMYNGFPADSVTAPRGATVLSVDRLEAGAITRGVLLDVAAVRGVEYLHIGEAAFPQDLEAAERKQGVEVGEGDAVLLHTGNFKRVRERGIDAKQGQSGYSAACLPWFYERGVAIISSDSINDVQPSGYDNPDLLAPIHAVGIVAMGLCLIDNMELDELAEVCQRLERWEFLFAMTNLRIVGSTSSPVNPIAIF